ncbi:MAG: DNA repair protein RecO [Candidatus Eremiobacteraeota bacterium]|nr:DNA repair protein RecO [Candidatus Eremiobacteraeota bacterium]
MKTYSIEGFVLRLRPLGEADRILTVFSRERGKFSAVAKGVRKVRSKFGSRLDFFNRSAMTLHVGRSLDVITGVASVAEVWLRLVDPDAFFLVSYVAEVVDALCEPDMAVPELYAMLCELQATIGGGTQPQSLMPAVDLRLLDALGLAPELDACTLCATQLGNRPLAGGRVLLSAESGGLVCRRCSAAAAADDADRMGRAGTMLRETDLQTLRALRTCEFAEAASAINAPALSATTHPLIQYQLGRRSRAMSALDASNLGASAARRGAAQRQ